MTDQSASLAIGEPRFFAPLSWRLGQRSDGALLLSSTREFSPSVASIFDWLKHWAAVTPNVPFVCERSERGWRALSYAQALDATTRLASGLAAIGVEPGDVCAAFAPNSVAHLKYAFAAMACGAIYAPIARQYSAAAADHAKLAGVLELLLPRLIFAGSREDAPLLWELPHDAEVLAGEASLDAHAIAALPLPLPAKNEASKLLLTSGTTGAPKAVVQTQATMCANMEMLLGVWPFLRRRPPVLFDGLPWNHAFGGNHNLHLTLSCGGTLYIDAGFGKPERLHETCEGLAEIRPTYQAGTPAYFDAIIPVLEAKPRISNAFFSRLDIVFTAGAAMSAVTHERLARLAHAAVGRTIPVATGWGSTELGPGATIVHTQSAAAGDIGAPLPGVEIALVRNGDKTELCVRSPSLSPGYYKRPGLMANALDEFGFYRSGDAGRLHCRGDLPQSLSFAGRIGDDFKLSNGTWVDCTAVTTALSNALGECARAAVVVGADRDALSALIWPTPGAAAGAIANAIADYNAGVKRPSARIVGFALISPPPSAAEGELNEKGQINRRAFIERRANLIDEAYRNAATFT